MDLLLDIIIIVALVFASGIYAALEIAVVYLRPSRVRELVEKGGSAARVVEDLQKNTGRFFAGVQTGMTVIATLASALGGAAAVKTIEPMIRAVPFAWAQKASEEIAMTLVVVVISYLFLVVGELVPKSLAVRYPERIALLLAPPMRAFSKALRPVVWFLELSQSFVLRLIPGGRAGKTDPVVSERELKILIDEGRRSGVLSATERDLMHAVFDFADRQVKDVMVPRGKAVAVPATASQKLLERTILEEGHTRMPVYGRDLDDIVGLIHARDVLYTEIERDLVNMGDIIREPFFTTPETMISRLMKEMQRKRMHMAVVRDAAGKTVGIVTLEDILEEIVGEIEDEGDVPGPGGR